MTPKIWIILAAIVLSSAIAVFGQEKNSSTSANSKQPSKTPKPLTVSCGICGQKAIYLPKPIYPAHFNGSGNVNVKVLIDELGNVISTEVLSGHPLLRAKLSKSCLSGEIHTHSYRW